MSSPNNTDSTTGKTGSTPKKSPGGRDPGRKKKTHNIVTPHDFDAKRYNNPAVKLCFVFPGKTVLTSVSRLARFQWTNSCAAKIIPMPTLLQDRPSVKGKRLRHNPRFWCCSHSCLTRVSTSFGHLCAYCSMSRSRLTNEEKDARLDLSQSRQSR